MRHAIIFTAVIVLGAGILGLCGSGQSAEPAAPATPAATAAAAAPARADLQVTDCGKCHPAFVQQVEEAGSKHKTDVTCLDCHEGTHPPGVAKGSLVPQCSKCHSDQPHFKLENCLGCHKNPHQTFAYRLFRQRQRCLQHLPFRGSNGNQLQPERAFEGGLLFLS